MKIKTIILCGGQGTRIREVAENIPKPMISIGERPILWHIMKHYASYGLNEFVLCLGYKSWMIKEFFINYFAHSSDLSIRLGSGSQLEYCKIPDSIEEWEVILAETGQATQTGGRLWKIRHYLQDSDIFCVTYGDGISNIDLNELLRFHKSHGRIATVTGVRPPGRFGVMQVDTAQGIPIIQQFEEKPQTAQGWINGGFFVFDQRFWDYLTDDPNLILEHEPLARLAADRELVMYEHHGFWQPMDTYREWKLLNELWDTQTVPWNYS